MPKPADLRLVTSTWIRLHGVVSLELAGVFTDMAVDPEHLLAHTSGATRITSHSATSTISSSSFARPEPSTTT